jgi:uncharacterized protein (TIGR00369 family)
MLIGLTPGSDDQEKGMSVGLCASGQFDSAVADLRQRGVPVDSRTESGGAVRLAFFTDPDGNRVYLTDAPPDPTSGFAGGPNASATLPFFEYLGLRWNTVNGDRVAVELDIRDDLRGPAGNLQGGITATLVDVAAASTAALSGTALVATTEMTVHYLAPGRVGPVRAVGELLHSGGRVVSVEVRVFDGGMDDLLMTVALVAFVSTKPYRPPDIDLTSTVTERSASPSPWPTG